MGKFCALAISALLLCGCSGDGRMAHPEDPQGRYALQIAAAKRLLQQQEDWADRAEWEVKKTSDGWELTAWRVEHPGEKGANRYLPWGCSIIELDQRMETVHYERKG